MTFYSEYRNPNWTHHSGPLSVAYVEDNEARTRKLSDRKKGLIKKAHELSIMCGVHVFLQLETESHRCYIYTDDDERWLKYCSSGIKRDPTKIEERVKYSDGVTTIEKRIKDKRVRVDINEVSKDVTPQKAAKRQLNYVQFKTTSTVTEAPHTEDMASMPYEPVHHCEVPPETSIISEPFPMYTDPSGMTVFQVVASDRLVTPEDVQMPRDNILLPDTQQPAAVTVTPADTEMPSNVIPQEVVAVQSQEPITIKKIEVITPEGIDMPSDNIPPEVVAPTVAQQVEAVKSQAPTTMQMPQVVTLEGIDMQSDGILQEVVAPTVIQQVEAVQSQAPTTIQMPQVVILEGIDMQQSDGILQEVVAPTVVQQVEAVQSQAPTTIQMPEVVTLEVIGMQSDGILPEVIAPTVVQQVEAVKSQAPTTIQMPEVVTLEGIDMQSDDIPPEVVAPAVAKQVETVQSQAPTTIQMAEVITAEANHMSCDNPLQLSLPGTSGIPKPKRQRRPSKTKEKVNVKEANHAPCDNPLQSSLPGTSGIPKPKRQRRPSKTKEKVNVKEANHAPCDNPLQSSLPGTSGIPKPKRQRRPSKTKEKVNVKEKIKALHAAKKNKSKSMYCFVCNDKYTRKFDTTTNPKGRWIGCEGEGCSTWVHGMCVGWSNDAIDSSRTFHCSVCLAADELG